MWSYHLTTIISTANLTVAVKIRLFFWKFLSRIIITCNKAIVLFTLQLSRSNFLFKWVRYAFCFVLYKNFVKSQETTWWVHIFIWYGTARPPYVATIIPLIFPLLKILVLLTSLNFFAFSSHISVFYPQPPRCTWRKCRLWNKSFLKDGYYLWTTFYGI